MKNNSVQKKSKTTDDSVSYKTLSKNEGGFFHGQIGMSESPFLLKNNHHYQSWREEKLSSYPVTFENLLVKIDNLSRITTEEKLAVLHRCNKHNMAIYQLNDPRCGPDALKSFAGNFGLERLDLHFCNDSGGITALRVSDENNKGGFIPYSDKAINWHTDGYYNPLHEQVHAVLLHCHTPASEGGENYLMDHEIAYIRLRDANPAFIEALMHKNAMTIPAHVENGKEVRPEQSGPVFSVHGNGERLHMRYSQRKRYIVWREDEVTQQAIKYLNHLLNNDKQDMLHIKLRAGQGVIANNILHTRSAFKNTKEQSRFIYRGRFFENIQ